MKVKVGTEEYEKKVIDLLSSTKQFCSIHYVAKMLDIDWATARSILKDLVIQGKLKQQHFAGGPPRRAYYQLV